MSFPFATTNLRLSTVLTAYGITNGSMNSLRGLTIYNSDGTTIVAPVTGNFSLVSTFAGRFSLNPAAFTTVPSSTGNVTIPSSATGRPPPVAFVLTLAGGGGGGGGAGGDYDFFGNFKAGGEGCGGGGGAYLQTSRIPYTSGNNITVNSIPTAGNGGSRGNNGGSNPGDGSGGSAGETASITYQGQTFFATGGSGGNPGFKGQSGGGGSPANQPVAGGSFSGTNISDSSNGNAGFVRTGGTSGGGRIIGKGGDGGQGSDGSPGIPGTILITWYFF